MGFARKRVGKDGKTRYTATYIDLRGSIRSAGTFASDIPRHIREWITRMQREGQSAWTIQYCKSSILSSIFTTALNDQVTYIHPCRGVRIPTVPATVRTIIIPEQFDVVYGALPDADAQLLVETAIESGLRWGELAELRVRDLDIATRMLTVSRKLTEVNREFHPDGGRFLVRLYPKDKEYRRLKLISPVWICSRRRAASCRYGCSGEVSSITTMAELTIVKHGIKRLGVAPPPCTFLAHSCDPTTDRRHMPPADVRQGSSAT